MRFATTYSKSEHLLLGTRAHSVYGISAAMLAAFVLVIALSAFTVMAPGQAWALTDDLLVGTKYTAQTFDGMSLSDLNALVDEKTETLKTKKERVVQIDVEIAENEKKLSKLEREIPVEEEHAARVVRESYKVQQNRADLTELLLSAEDFDTFLAGVKYIEVATEMHIDDLVDLREQRDECEYLRTALQEEKTQLKQDIETVHDELIAAIIARNEEQRLTDLAANSKDLVPDRADWTMTEEDFVAVWAPRINRYYKGTAMADTGEYFARAAYKNHIDPRWSPAISCIESGKGRICIRPHNAWGWGASEPDPAGNAASWESWEIAINAHVKGLATGYGYSVTKDKAKTYCPPNWEKWYNWVVSEMNTI